MKANQFVKNDEGVSAVIGVILMVAITVILAAVIAAFVFGMVGGVGNKVSPAFTTKRVDATHVQVTLQDKNGATSLTGFAVTLPAANVAVTDANNVAIPSTTQLTVGTIVLLTGTGIDNTAGPVHIVATAMVNSNSQVVLDTSV